MSRSRPQAASVRTSGTTHMAKLTARDYKAAQRRPFELRGFREFGYGLFAGVLLTAMAFTWLGRSHKTVDAPDAPA